MKTKKKVQTVTGNQILTASLAAILAGGLAFAVVPVSRTPFFSKNACTVASYNLNKSCGKGKVQGGSVICSNGVKISLGAKCQTFSQAKQLGGQACAKLSCGVSKKAVTPRSVSTSEKEAAAPDVLIETPLATTTPAAQFMEAPAPAQAVRNRPGPDLVQMNAQPVELHACGTPEGGWQPYTNYILAQDLQIPAGQSCFSIGPGVHDISIDCRNHILNGQGAQNTFGFSFSGMSQEGRFNQYNEVKNCRIQNVRDGISVTNVHYTRIQGNTIESSSRNAISVYGNNNVIEGNTSINNKSKHISIHNSTQTNVIGNTLFTNTPWTGNVSDLDDGISLTGEFSRDNRIEENTIDSVRGNGIYISGGVENTVIRSNSIQRVDLVGVTMYLANAQPHLTFENNLVCGNGRGQNMVDVQCYDTVVLTGSGNRLTNTSGCGQGWPLQGIHYETCQ